mmetsp:Transcript_16064/g.18559  ORF Transcript_16064/g.18559 Transcript_16064/m.18559 type:complete len:562 (+) Transcript_16064:139-1824(+)
MGSIISFLVLLCNSDALLVHHHHHLVQQHAYHNNYQRQVVCGEKCSLSQRGNIIIHSRKLYRGDDNDNVDNDNNNDLDKYFLPKSDNDMDNEIAYRQFRKKQEELEIKIEAELRREYDINSNHDGFDLKKEMKKVQYISPSIKKEERQIENDFVMREGQMYDAKEDYDLMKAGRIQDEIAESNIDDCGSVLQVNSAFYRAFKEKDMTLMEQVWSSDNDDTSTQCIHPSQKPLLGTPTVLKSWNTVFKSSDKTSIWMEPTNIHLVIRGCTAILTCDENVYCRRSSVKEDQKQSSSIIENINKLTATNIFRKVTNKWYMSHHHASYHVDSNAAKNALPSSDENTNNSSNKKKNSSYAEAIMGTNDFDPYVSFGSGEKTATNNNSEDMKKIIMLPTNLDGGGGGLGDINSILKSIFNSNEDDFDEDDDIDEDSEDIINNSNNDDTSSWKNQIDKLLSSSSSGINNNNTTSMVVMSDITSDINNSIDNNKNNNKQQESSIRQDCIGALRKLNDKGNISQEQKRILLTDIITCSARGEYSQVEVAYELLLCNNNNNNNINNETNYR